MATYNFDYEAGTPIENLTQVVSITLDELKAYTDQIMDVFDVDMAQPEHLPIIGALFGFQIDTNEDPEYQRKLLKTSIDLLKTKGTIEAFQIVFSNLGYNVKVHPMWTADVSEEVTVNLPYIQINNLPPNAVGTYDIVVLNPDDQLDTLVAGIEYIF